MENRRNLSSQERTLLEARGCFAEEWDNILVAPSFRVEQLRNVRFGGHVSIGANTFISDAVIRNYDIGQRCTIESVMRLECRHTTTFGEGVRVSVVNENGGREVIIYRDLTAQAAYLMAMMRHRKAATEAILSLAEKRAERRVAERGYIGDDVTIIGAKFLRELYLQSNRFHPQFPCEHILFPSDTSPVHVQTSHRHLLHARSHTL
jgi:hypothetical protein